MSLTQLELLFSLGIFHHVWCHTSSVLVFDRVIPHAGQIFYPAATYQNSGMLLQVVTFATDIGIHFETVHQSHATDFTDCGIRFLRSGGIYACADAALLRTSCKRRYLTFGNLTFSRFPNQLTYRCQATLRIDSISVQLIAIARNPCSACKIVNRVISRANFRRNNMNYVALLWVPLTRFLYFLQFS